MKRSILTIIATLLLSVLIFPGCSETESSVVELHLTAMGMHCDGCEETIVSTFNKMPGVDSVSADYMTKDVFVLVDTTQTTYARLEELISELGFDMMNEDEM
jgi:copper chaperone CopZ